MFNRTELARVTGFSRTRLRFWEQDKSLRPAAGNALYTFAQAVGVMALAELERLGMAARKLKRIAALGLPAEADRARYLLVMENGIMCAARDPAEAWARMAGTGNVSLRLLDAEELRERLA